MESVSKNLMISYDNVKDGDLFEEKYVLEAEIYHADGVGPKDYTKVGIFLNNKTNMYHIIVEALTDVKFLERDYTHKYIREISDPMTESEITSYLIDEKKIGKSQTYKDFLAEKN